MARTRVSGVWCAAGVGTDVGSGITSNAGDVVSLITGEKQRMV